MKNKQYFAKVAIIVMTAICVCGLICACHREPAVPDTVDSISDGSGTPDNPDRDSTSAEPADPDRDTPSAEPADPDWDTPSAEPVDPDRDTPSAGPADPDRDNPSGESADPAQDSQKCGIPGEDPRDLSLGLMKLTDVGVCLHKFGAERVNTLTFEYAYEHNEGFDEFCRDNEFTAKYLQNYHKNHIGKEPDFNSSLVKIDGLKDSGIEDSINAWIAGVYEELASPEFLPGYRGIYAFLRENPTAFAQVVTDVGYNCNNILSISVIKRLYSWTDEVDEAVSYPYCTVEYRVPLNFNLETGNLLALADLYPEGSDYLGTLSGYVFTDYVTSDFSFRDSYRDNPEADPEMSGLYTDESEYDGAGLFTGIESGQRFYIDTVGSVVLVFDDRTPSLWKPYKYTDYYRIWDPDTDEAELYVGGTVVTGFYPNELVLTEYMLSEESAGADATGKEVRPMLGSVTGLRDIFESEARFRFGRTFWEYRDDEEWEEMPYSQEMYNLHGNEIKLRIGFPEDWVMLNRDQSVEIAKDLLECDRAAEDNECEISFYYLEGIGADCEIIEVSIFSEYSSTSYDDVLVRNGRLVGRDDIFAAGLDPKAEFERMVAGLCDDEGNPASEFAKLNAEELKTVADVAYNHVVGYSLKRYRLYDKGVAKIYPLFDRQFSEEGPTSEERALLNDRLLAAVNRLVNIRSYTDALWSEPERLSIFAEMYETLGLYESDSAEDTKETGEDIVADGWEPDSGRNPGDGGQDAAPAIPGLTADNLPVIDGALALEPFYKAAIAKILGTTVDEAAMYIQCNNTPMAYSNLIDKKADMIFCALPSEDQIAAATDAGVEFEYHTILSGGFVFFTNKDNPVDSVTQEQLQGIFRGDITNWKELGGNDEPIMIYQRNEGSGSQTGLYRYVLPKDEVIKPAIDQVESEMMGVIDRVSAYDNGTGALSYSYYYYVSNMYYSDRIKLLAIDGVTPNDDTIARGEYPFLNFSQIVIRKGTPKDSPVYAIIDWVCSEEGAKNARENNYVPYLGE